MSIGISAENAGHTPEPMPVPIDLDRYRPVQTFCEESKATDEELQRLDFEIIKLEVWGIPYYLSHRGIERTLLIPEDRLNDYLTLPS